MVKTNKRLFKRRVSTSEVVLINRTASLYLPPLRQFFTPRFYHIQGLHPHLLVTNIITCYHIHVFFCYKKLLSPTLYTRRLFSDGTDIDNGGVLPILRNNEMVKLDKWSTDVGVQWILSTDTDTSQYQSTDSETNLILSHNSRVDCGDEDDSRDNGQNRCSHVVTYSSSTNLVESVSLIMKYW